MASLAKKVCPALKDSSESQVVLVFKVSLVIRASLDVKDSLVQPAQKEKRALYSK